MASDRIVRRTLDQVAALPVRLHAEGFVEVMLITSRETSRWIIPKDWSSPELVPQEVAARTASEEVGQLYRWPERGLRRTAWLASREAAKRLCNLSLQR